MRKVLKVKKSTNSYDLYGELGRYSMKTSRELIIIKFWLNILKSTNPLLINSYKMLKDDANNGLTYSGLNWAHHVKSIVQHICLGNLWMLQNPDSIKYLYIKQRILDIFKQSWYSLYK